MDPVGASATTTMQSVYIEPHNSPRGRRITDAVVVISVVINYVGSLAALAVLWLVQSCL